MVSNAAYRWEGFFDGTGAGELQVLLVLFLRYRSHTLPLPASFSGQIISSMLGLLAAEGPFAAVRLPEPVVEGEFCFLCVFLLSCRAHATSVPFPVPSCQRNSRGSCRTVVCRPRHGTDAVGCGR